MLHTIKTFLHKYHKSFIWLIVIISIVPMVVSPALGLSTLLSERLAWVGVGIVLSEALFIIGLIIIASDVGLKLGRNPLLWRSHVLPAIRTSSRERVFWTGFVINTLGALGTAAVVAIGVVVALPPQSWGLLLLPTIDIGITLAIRAAALDWLDHGPKKPGRS